MHFPVIHEIRVFGNFDPTWCKPENSEFQAFLGRYRSDSGDDVRVFVRKGALWLGDSPLTEIGSALFRVGDDSWSPDTAEFLTIVDGNARLLRATSEDCWRIEVGS